MAEHGELRRVLYVEDEPDIQALVRLSLEKLGGLEVQVCSSAAEALAVATGFAPDLLLLDVMMPGMDGPTLLGELRRLPATATTPAVFITARVMPAEIAGYRERGAADVIIKPFDPLELAARLRRIWERCHGR